MSSNIETTRICEFSNNEFFARTATTSYSSHSCIQRHYKAKAKQTIIKASNMGTFKKGYSSIGTK